MNDADIVVVSSFSIAAMMAAETLAKPTISVPLSPIVLLSTDDPPALEQLPLLPTLRRIFGPGVARLAYGLGRLKLRRLNQQINAQRLGLGLPILAGNAFIDGPYRADRVVALYSPLLGGTPLHPPTPTTIAGFAFYDRDAPDGDQLAPEIHDFLAQGDSPLVFTLGSLAVLTAGSFYEEATLAARRMGRRAIPLVGRDARDALHVKFGASDILVIGYAPLSLMLKRCAACIYHGGIGTTAQALIAGVPQLICPIFGDQGDNAYRVRRLGVGALLPHARFTAARAARKLEALLSDPGVPGRAKQIAATVAGEGGARRLAEIIADLLGKRGAR